MWKFRQKPRYKRPRLWCCTITLNPSECKSFLQNSLKQMSFYYIMQESKPYKKFNHRAIQIKKPQTQVIHWLGLKKGMIENNCWTKYTFFIIKINQKMSEEITLIKLTHCRFINFNRKIFIIDCQPNQTIRTNSFTS